MTVARSTVTGPARVSSCRAVITAACAAWLPASQAARKAGVAVKERAASSAKTRFTPISWAMPSPTESATASRTAGSAASGAIVVT